MIIYEDDTLVIPVGLGNSFSDITDSLQEKTVEINNNGTLRVTPDSGYTALSKVNIHTEVPTEVNNQDKEITINGITRKTVYPDSGYTGLSSVAVSTSMTLQDKFVKLSNNDSVIATADPGYDALKSVEIYVDVPLNSITIDSSTERQHISINPGGYNDITVNPLTLEEGYFDSSTVAQEYSSSYDGFSKVYINPLSLSSLTITPQKTSQIFDGAYDFVRVNPVTSSIDSNITPENIRKDISILGVTGTLEAIGDMQELTVDSSTETQIFTPDSSLYLGYSKVTVNKYTNSFAELFDTATFYESDSSINLTPENLSGLMYVRTAAFSGDPRAPQWYRVYYDFTLPSSVISIGAYPWSSGVYHDINLYNCDITNWPGPGYHGDGGGTNYNNFSYSTINSITFPRKLQTFEYRNDFVIGHCNIQEINLEYCTQLTNVRYLVSDSSVNSIVLPSSVTGVYRLAENCQYLTDIYCNRHEAPRNYDYLVNNIKTGGTLHVPQGWSDYWYDWVDPSERYSLGYYGWTITDDL